MVPGRDPEKLGEAIFQLSQDLEYTRGLAEMGVETARGFTWQRAGNHLENILENQVSSF